MMSLKLKKYVATWVMVGQRAVVSTGGLYVRGSYIYIGSAGHTGGCGDCVMVRHSGVIGGSLRVYCC